MQKRSEGLIAICLIAVGFVLRVAGAAWTYLHPDEIQYFLLSLPKTLRGLYFSGLRTDHPPLLFFLQHPVDSATVSQLAIRAIPILAGTIFLWIAYRWVANLWTPGAGLAALLILSLSPNLVQLGGQARGYPLEFLFCALSLLLLEIGIEKQSTGAMVLFSLTLSLAILSEYSSIWVAGAAGVYFLLRAWHQKIAPRVVWVWGFGQAVVLALCGVLYRTLAIPRLAHRQAGIEDSLLSEFPGTHQNALMFTLVGTGKQFLYSLSSIAHGLVGALLFTAALVMLWRGRSPGDRTRNRALAALLVLPFMLACSTAVLKVHPYGNSRHTAVLSIFVAAGCGIALDAIFRNRARVAAAAAVVLVLSWVVSTKMTWRETYLYHKRKASLVEASRDLRASVPPGSIIVTDLQSAEPLHFYSLRTEQIAGQKEFPYLGTIPFGTSQMYWFQWEFATDEVFLNDLTKLRDYQDFGRDTQIWVVTVFDSPLQEQLRRRFPDASFPAAHTFEGSFTIFPLPQPFPR